MGSTSGLNDLAHLYIFTMILMAFVQPIIGIISQICAVLVIQKVTKWWQSRPKKVHDVSTNEGGPSGKLP